MPVSLSAIERVAVVPFPTPDGTNGPPFALPPTPFDRGREEGGRRARGPPSAQLLSQREALALGLRTDSPLDQ